MYIYSNIQRYVGEAWSLLSIVTWAAPQPPCMVSRSACMQKAGAHACILAINELSYH